VADPILESRLKRLMLFRVVMITTLLLVAVYVEAVSEVLPLVSPLYFLIAATYALTIAYVTALRYVRRLEYQAVLQIFMDLLTITGLVYVTGWSGSRAGFMLLYPISVLSGSVLLYRRAGLLLSGLATLSYAAMLFAVRMRWAPPLALGDVPLMPARQLVYSIFVTGVACTTVALIGSYLSENLRRERQRLAQTADEMADLREFNEVIVNSIQSGLLTTDAAGRILHLNRFGEAILDRRALEIRGLPLRDVLSSPQLETGPAGRGGPAPRHARLEVAYRRPDGSGLQLGVSIAPLASADPGKEGFLLVFQDLTQIKHLEEQVRVKEKLAAVGEMAAYLAHEIRNPLGSISGSAQVLMEEPNLSPDQERLLDIIHRESRRLSDSLNQFLFQARPSKVPLGLVDLGPVISEAVALLANAPEVGAGHHVEFDADAGPYPCLARRDHIVQVFWNLVRNGLEAMPEGGWLRIRLSRDRGDVVLSIDDEGVGIAREQQRRIFEPFHSTTSSGTGLGLAIVYRIVKEHGGDIAVSSSPSQGTLVQVRLPLAEAAVTA